LKYRFALPRWVDAVVVNSSAMTGSFARLPGFDPGRIRVIHNGVGPARATAVPGRLRASLGITSEVFVIGTAARLADQKRIDRLVEALSLLPADVHCVIAGDGERKAAVEAEAAARGVGSRLHLLGHREDLAEVFDAMDVYVVSSDREGLSNAMLEAMSAGLPVVSTRVSGAEDALGLREGRNAGLITDLSAQAIRLAVLELKDHESMRRELGAEAARRAAEDFSTARLLDQWEAVLFGPLPERA
jgi:glycosyltransferase involved in cell wall biosynthesis